MKSTFKKMCCWIAGILTFPLACGYWFTAFLSSRERAFPGWSQLISLWPGISGIYLRNAYYSWVLPECGQAACISFGTVLTHPKSKIGRGTYIGPYCNFGDVTIEQDVLISSHVSVINGTQQHGIDSLEIPVRDQPGKWPKIRIGCDTWIGERAVIAADLGSHCVIGAGAVVIEPIPDYGIAVGIPAKVIRYRNSSVESTSPTNPQQPDVSAKSSP